MTFTKKAGNMWRFVCENLTDSSLHYGVQDKILSKASSCLRRMTPL
jgi:hypothetical protein